MSENTDIIEAEFTVQEINPENLPSIVVDDDGKMSEVDIEFEYARANIINIIQQSDKVLTASADLAVEAEHPSMINAYAGLIKSLADVNKSLFDIREKKMNIKGENVDATPMPGKVSQTNVTNNTIFVGSTDDLINAIKG